MIGKAYEVFFVDTWERLFLAEKGSKLKMDKKKKKKAWDPDIRLFLLN